MALTTAGIGKVIHKEKHEFKGKRTLVSAVSGVATGLLAAGITVVTFVTLASVLRKRLSVEYWRWEPDGWGSTYVKYTSYQNADLLRGVGAGVGGPIAGVVAGIAGGFGAKALYNHRKRKEANAHLPEKRNEIIKTILTNAPDKADAAMLHSIEQMEMPELLRLEKALGTKRALGIRATPLTAAIVNRAIIQERDELRGKRTTVGKVSGVTAGLFAGAITVAAFATLAYLLKNQLAVKYSTGNLNTHRNYAHAYLLGGLGGGIGGPIAGVVAGLGCGFGAEAIEKRREKGALDVEASGKRSEIAETLLKVAPHLSDYNLYEPIQHMDVVELLRLEGVIGEKRMKRLVLQGGAPGEIKETWERLSKGDDRDPGTAMPKNTEHS